MKEKYLIAIREYMQGGTKAAALISAGFSRSVAYDHPEFIFGRKEVVHEIEKRQRKLDKAANLSAQYVLERLTTMIEHDGVSDANKLRALELVAKHLGMLTDKINIKVEEDLVGRLQAGRNRVSLPVETD